MHRLTLNKIARDLLAHELRDEELTQRVKTKLLQSLPDPQPEGCLVDDAIEEAKAIAVEALFKK
jgi:hypothetical protein